MKMKCDYCWDKFDHEPIEVERHILLAEMRLYFCSEKCFNYYKKKWPEGGVVSYKRKEEK